MHIFIIFSNCSPYAFSCSLPVYPPPLSPLHTTSLNPHAYRLQMFVSLFSRCTLVTPGQSSVRWDDPIPFHLHSIPSIWNRVRNSLGQRWQNAVFKDMFAVRQMRRKKKWNSYMGSNPGPWAIGVTDQWATTTWTKCFTYAAIGTMTVAEEEWCIMLVRTVNN